MRTFLALAPSTAQLASGSRIAACAALWCGVHCAVTPLLVLAAPALALSEGIERIAWFGTVLLGTVTLGLGPARTRPRVVLSFAAGALLWGASLAGWLEPLPETLTSAAGSLILAGALVLSARACRAGVCEDCAEEARKDPDR